MATPDLLSAINQAKALVGNGFGSDIIDLAEKVAKNGATAADAATGLALAEKYGATNIGSLNSVALNPDTQKRYAELLAKSVVGQLSGDALAEFNELSRQFNLAIGAGGSLIGAGGASSVPISTKNLSSIPGLSGISGLSGIPGLLGSSGASGLQQILSKVVAPKTASGVIPGLSIDNNLFKTDETTKGFGVKALSQKATAKVNEIGIFAVDDATGKIGTLLPGSTEYIKAALESAKSIFSTLGGNFLNTDKQEFAIDPSKNYQFFQIQDSSISDLKQQLAKGQTPNNILFSLPDKDGNSAIQVTNNADNSGYNVAINGNELVLDVVKLGGVNVQSAIGSELQRAPEGRLIDLSAFAGQNLKVDIVTKSSAGYTNNVGFYVVENASGAILVDGVLINPSDPKYAEAAVKNALDNAQLQAGKSETSLDQTIAGGRIYAPVVIAQGTFEDFLSKNPTNGGGKDNIHALFNYSGASSDGIDHFRLVGSNTFAVEDTFGGGDRDFNDLVVSMNVKAPVTA